MITSGDFALPRCACGGSPPLVGYVPVSMVDRYLKQKRLRPKRVQVRKSASLPWRVLVYMQDGRVFPTWIETQSDLDLVNGWGS